MALQWTVSTKPSRSDHVLDANQQLQIASQIRAQFDSIAPKRPPKPNRSESDATESAPVSSDHDQNTIPELHKLRSLQSQSSGVLSVKEASMEQDEFVETHYYKELNSIDKQHHKTGSGFISVEKEETANGCDIQLPIGNGTPAFFSGSRSNPATNDWIPRPDYGEGFASSKPNRSESS